MRVVASSVDCIIFFQLFTIDGVDGVQRERGGGGVVTAKYCIEMGRDRMGERGARGLRHPRPCYVPVLALSAAEKKDFDYWRERRGELGRCDGCLCTDLFQKNHSMSKCCPSEFACLLKVKHIDILFFPVSSP